MAQRKFSFRLAGKAFKQSFKGFSDDKVTKLSASLSYYTVFSLAPLLLTIIALAGIFLGHEAATGTIEKQIRAFIGADGAKQIQDMIRNASISGKGMMATIIGIITLLVGATGVFAEIQDSINSIWGLKAKPKAGIMKIIKTRLLSFGLIGSIGFLLLVSLGVSAVVESLGDRLRNMFPSITVVLFYIINFVLTLGITSLLFCLIFKVLPDAKIRWRDVLPGAVATSLLFMIGKFLITLYISKSNVASTFGAAGSLVVLLVWVYYSAIILYFGAEFTKFYALDSGARIEPNSYAEWVDKPAVAGAQPTPASQPGRRPAPSQQKRPHLAFTQSSRPAPKERKSPPGMGTVLFGLVLYYFNKGKDKG